MLYWCAALTEHLILLQLAGGAADDTESDDSDEALSAFEPDTDEFEQESSESSFDVSSHNHHLTCSLKGRGFQEYASEDDDEGSDEEEEEVGNSR